MDITNIKKRFSLSEIKKLRIFAKDLYQFHFSCILLQKALHDGYISRANIKVCDIDNLGDENHIVNYVFMWDEVSSLIRKKEIIKGFSESLFEEMCTGSFFWNKKSVSVYIIIKQICLCYLEDTKELNWRKKFL